MATLITTPTVVEAAGHPPKRIEEIVGRVNTGESRLSIAHMRSPKGWSEPAQVPEFDEWTYVLSGEMEVETVDGALTVKAGQAIHTPAGERVRYGTPNSACEYVAVCLPAFAPDTVHRQEG